MMWLPREKHVTLWISAVLSSACSFRSPSSLTLLAHHHLPAMSLAVSINIPPQLEIARMLLEDLRSPEFAQILCASDTSTLESLGEIVAASYTGIRALTNATQPINRLPPEILINIFSLVKRPLIYQYRNEALPVDSMFDVRDLRPLILTCRRWRSLITATPSLWSTVMDVFSPYVRFQHISRYYLQYAVGGGPLYLYVSSSRNPDGAVCPEVLNVCRRTDTASRLHGIYLNCGHRCSGECYMILHSALPNLEYCCITRTLGCRNIGQYKRNFRRILPRSPKLKCLILNVLHSLSESSLPTTTFPALTTLRIDELYYERDCTALLNFLAGTPQLQDLLIQAECSDYDEDFSFAGRVPLHHLRTLRVADRTTNDAIFTDCIPRSNHLTLVKGLLQLLSHISLPPSGVDYIELTSLPISTLRTVLEAVDASGGTDFVRATSVNLQHEGYTSNTRKSILRPGISIVLCYAKAYKIKVTFLACKETKVPRQGQQGHPMGERRTAAQETCAHLCDLFSATSMFSGTRGLWLSDATWITCAPPHSILSSFPQLAMLVVDLIKEKSTGCSGAETIDRAHAYNPQPVLEGLKPGPDGTAPCALLHTLAICCVPGADGMLAEVKEVARERAKAGSPLSSVIVLRVVQPSSGKSEDEAMLHAEEYDYDAADDGGLKLVQEYEGRDTIYQDLKAKWARLTEY
ncbi:hypothetical protein BC628DRAFT_854578 [Trametes gibbosa]|nr:hypothetical protein BC628DRAFT_854578 [Trametes gibbosa]